ncbi:hypothetical protein C9374_009058 [Naegleria lovaniensis]|uniref:AB hydrolase-1 domain-containing protein n=1 Tax=Naegleria lovaniensis TaxID=51637 RepID=A0AA88GDQ3_NAELO|nr:uncharacterized protein C9374_009058 [Naegleria lovaniensis]KAG2377542.1 hypothetical protein C9374_009058 [Naegleria lovaniensis]
MSLLQHLLLLFISLCILWTAFANTCRKYLYSVLDSTVYEKGKSFTEHLINRTDGFECKVFTCKTKDGCRLQLLRIMYKGEVQVEEEEEAHTEVVSDPQQQQQDKSVSGSHPPAAAAATSTSHTLHPSTINYCKSAQQLEELLHDRELHKQKPVVFLQHGLLESMTVWCLHKDSLAFQLARRGFDVWLGNNRTSWFGQQHLVSRLHDEVDFWKFSIDEIIYYDMPAMIDFVRHATGQDKICWMGMSQGAGQLFAALSLPELEHYKNYLFAIVGISPACFLKKNPNGLILRGLMKIPRFFFGDREFVVGVAFSQLLLPKNFIGYMGERALRWLNIQQKPLPNDPMKGEWFKNIPLGCTSVNNVTHWFNMLRTGGCLRKFNDQEVYPIDSMLAKWKEMYHSGEHDMGATISSHDTNSSSSSSTSNYVPPIMVCLGAKDNVVDFEESLKQFGCDTCSSLNEMTSKNCSMEGKNNDHNTSCHHGAFKQCRILVEPEYGHTDFLWSEVDDKLLQNYNQIIGFVHEQSKLARKMSNASLACSSFNK